MVDTVGGPGTPPLNPGSQNIYNVGLPDINANLLSWQAALSEAFIGANQSTQANNEFLSATIQMLNQVQTLENKYLEYLTRMQQEVDAKNSTNATVIINVSNNFDLFLSRGSNGSLYVGHETQDKVSATSTDIGNYVKEFESEQQLLSNEQTTVSNQLQSGSQAAQSVMTAITGALQNYQHSFQSILGNMTT